MTAFDGLRARRLAEVNARYAEVLGAGFPTAALAGEPAPETLQCRNELDRTNWIGLLLKCQAAIAQGAGLLVMDIPIRTTANRNYFVTYNDAQARMFVLLQQAAVAQANWWRLKDAVRAVEAETRADAARFLQAIDLNAGWS